MNNKKLVVLIIFLALLASTIGFAADYTDEEVTPGVKKIYLDPPKNFIEKGVFKYLLAATAGYDNNSLLDSEREGDGFAQTFFRASFISPLSKATTATFNYEMMNLLYGSESELDLIKNGIKAGLERKLSDNFTLSTALSFDSIEYYHTGLDDFLDSNAEIKIQQKLPFEMYHSLGYDLLQRNYAKRTTRTTATTNTDKERNDFRNTLTYELGKYFEKDLLKTSFEYFNNNSNEMFLKYYDYDSYKIGGSYTHLFNDKVFGYMSFSSQLRDYRSRTLINDAGALQWEKTYLSTAALFYNLNKSVSFGLNYTYRRNTSNEPVDRYSGSLITLSTYYKF